MAKKATKKTTPAKSNPKPAKPAPIQDVVLPQGRTEDGEGMHVLRARPGKLEFAEMRPLKEGKPIAGSEIVSLKQREDQPALYDVKVEMNLSEGGIGKPARVATEAYRDNWDNIFGAPKKRKRKKRDAAEDDLLLN